MANIIVVGCGRVGSQLAVLLSQGDGNVCVVDKDAAAFSNLGRNFNGNTLQGVGFDEDVLVRAGVEEADCVAAVTQSDNSNLMVAEVARRDGSVSSIPARDSVLYHGDSVLACIHHALIEDFSKYMQR